MVSSKSQNASQRLKQQIKEAYQRAVSIPLARAAAPFRTADIAIFHEFRPPPAGGGHQFMRALWRELERRGFRLENNTISHTSQACLFNSYNFHFERLRQLRRPGCPLIHRVDGPMQTYRGFDNGSDARIAQINAELADATILQSHYSLQKHQELGFHLRNPHVIINVPAPDLFHPQGRLPFARNRKVRLISASWSDNPNKGAAIYKQIEEQLDWTRFEYTFVGNTRIPFERIRTIPPVPSAQLADLLREHDIYITASRNDPCSNSLLEALACGLPALYLQSGGHPEIVGEAGFGFDSADEAVARLDQLVDEYEARQAHINVPDIARVADQYLAVMGLEVPAEQSYAVETRSSQ